MSTTPPDGPDQPSWQPQDGPPYPPQGPPQQGQPYPQQGYPQQGYPQGSSEYLQSGGGQPLPPGGPQPRSRRPLVITALVVGAAVLVGGGVAGAFALKGFIGAGAQPAEALPADTVGYLSVNFDPSGEQKVEALKMLNKFPAFRAEVDIDTDDDIRKAFFDEALQECSGVSFEDDVEPWLGNRVAVAAIPGGEAGVTPVGVVEVTDGDAAETGIKALTDACGGGETGGFVIAGDWAVLAETDDIAKNVAADAEKGTLADEAEYQRWTGEAGDSGIVSAYLAPKAGELLAETITGMSSAEAFGEEVPAEGMDAWRDFGGMAATLRFEDAGLEVEYAGDGGPYAAKVIAAEGAGDAVSSLPADTAFAFGAGFKDGWVTVMADEIANAMGQGQTGQEMLDEFSAQIGLELPADLETLLGDSVALGVGSDLDPASLEGSEPPTDVPVGVKIKGDAEAIEAVLDKLRSTDPSVGEVLVSEAGDGYVVISPSDDYRKKLLEDGGLGDSETYQDVIPEEGRDGAVLFLDLDAGDWLEQLAAEDGPETAENVEPLSAVGLSGWLDGDVSHGLLRITTD